MATHSRLIFILAAIITIGPLSVDLYLPAMPSMVGYFSTSLSQVQLTLSSYLLGFALFHLVCGPLSDRFGRKPVLLAGMALYTAMSLLCAYASSIEELILYRFFQAMGACCAPTLGRAIVRDVFPPAQSVKALAYVSSLMALAPVVAPTIGGILVLYGDWRLNFEVLAAAGVVAMLLTIFAVPESLPHRQTLHPANILRNYTTLLSNRHYMGCVLTASGLYASVFAFLSGASFVLIDSMGVKPEHFGLYFLPIVSGYITGNLLTARIAHTTTPNTLFRSGLTSAVVAALVMVTIALLQLKSPLLLVLPMFFITFGVGLVLPQAMALALHPFPQMAATASAMMGFLQMAAASLAGLLVGLALRDDALPMTLVILATVLSAVVCYQRYIVRNSHVILLP
jgi:DHA1 family bicyclomycin/chloramphenicol resistance-like MFS transporter